MNPKEQKLRKKWSYSPEVKALRDFRRKRNDKKALEILDRIYDEINQDERPRLDWVEQAVGFRQDMWDAAQEVIRSCKKRVVILTSFSNSKYSADVAELLAEASEDSLLLKFCYPSANPIVDVHQKISKIQRNTSIISLKTNGSILEEAYLLSLAMRK